MRTTVGNRSKRIFQDAFTEIGIIENLPENLFFEFSEAFKNQYAPDFLFWSYNLATQSFNFIDAKFKHAVVPPKSEKLFVANIKPCYRKVFYAAVNAFIEQIAHGSQHYSAELCMLLPYRLQPDVYYTVKINIVPHIVRKQVNGFVIKLMPVSICRKDSLELFIVKDGVYSQQGTQLLKDVLPPPGISLTPTQQKMLGHIRAGLSTHDIATLEGTTTHSVYKLNRVIIEKVSAFFETDFKDARQAASYYFSAFN